MTLPLPPQANEFPAGSKENLAILKIEKSAPKIAK